jgi:DNA invertase Pin-like site-specific DNA recombinase
LIGMSRNLRALPQRRLRAALYGRASSDPKKRGRSIRDQLAECRADCDDNDWEIVGEYEDRDRGATRRATKVREDWDRLIDDVKAGKIDVIVYAEASRATRDPRKFLDLRDLCEEYGVYLSYGGRLFDMSLPADRRATLNDMAAAEEEGETIQRRTARTTRLNAQRGWPHSKPPPGFLRRYDPEDGRLIGQFSDPKMVPVMRDVFARAAARESLLSLRDLLRPHLPDITPSGVRSLLRNPSYIGLRSHKSREVTYKAQWDGIIDEGVFWAVQQILDEPDRRTARDTRAKHLLSGIVQCSVCLAAGAPTAGMVAKYHPRDRCWRYVCPRKSCVSAGLPALEAAVEAAVFAWLASESAVAAFMSEDSQAELRTTKTRLDVMRAQLTDAQTRAASFDQVTGLPLLSVGALATMERNVLPLIAKAEADVRRLSASGDPLLSGLVGQSIEQIAEMWNEELVVAQRRHVLRNVVMVQLLKATRNERRLSPERLGTVFFGEPGFRVIRQRNGHKDLG